MHKRRIGTPAKFFYYGMLVVFGLLAILAAIAGWWLYSAGSLLLGIAFIASGPFVLGRGWRPPERMPTRRPVVRRRR